MGSQRVRHDLATEQRSQKQNIQQMWDNITKCNMYVVGMLEGT